MNSKSLVFIFALLALFSFASTSSVSDSESSEVDDFELLTDAVSLMQKILKSKENKEKQKIAHSLVVEKAPVINQPIEKNVVINEEEANEYEANQEDEDIEVVTVTIEVDEDGEIIDDSEFLDTTKTVVDNLEDVAEDEEVDIGIIDDNENLPEFNTGDDGLRVVAADFDGEEQGATVDYNVDESNLKVEPEQVTYYYTVDEGEYNEEEDAVDGVIVDVETVESKEEKKSGALGASIAIIGAFGVVAGFGYKYSKRNKRILLPFHEDLDNKEMFDKNSAEQHIIPVWAATCKKEEKEEEKEEEEEKLFEVVYNYEPELPDELKLTVGDKIKIKEIYEDGWAYGYNKTTQLFGTFPSTSLGEDFNPESVPQYKPEEVAVEVNDNTVEELKKKIVESN